VLDGVLTLQCATCPTSAVPQYLRKIAPVLREDLTGRVFVVCVTLVLAWAQYLGLEIVGVTSNVVIVTTMLPFVILVVWGIPQMEWSQVVAEKEGDVNWALLLTNLFWNLNYCETRTHCRALTTSDRRHSRFAMRCHVTDPRARRGALVAGDSVSTLASEVKNPSRTYPRALAVAMVFTVLM
jgi:amino acid transporter